MNRNSSFGFTLVEMLIVIALSVVTLLMLYGPAKEQARLWELRSVALDAQQLVNHLDKNRRLGVSDFLEEDVAVLCNVRPGIECVYQEEDIRSILTVTIDTPEGEWKVMGADSTLIGTPEDRKTELVFYSKGEDHISQQYTFFPKYAGKQNY